MSGTIEAPRPSAFGEKSVNLANYEKQLANAFKSPGCAAVVLEINSPGGSPVQSALLHNRLKALREKHPEVALLCFCTDICASGGYYIASACDEIHVLPSSLVGSIGVVSPSVGLTGLMKTYGIEDRTMTAGTSKVGDSPLAPRNPVAVAQKRRLLDELHEDFRAAVTSARGKKLRHAEAAAYARRCGDRKSRAERATALFDGSIYAGKTAVAFGLADGLYEDLEAALQRRFGADLKLREIKRKPGIMEKLQTLQEAGAAAHATAFTREASLELARLSSGAEAQGRITLVPTAGA